jgi:hypothetical protein
MVENRRSIATPPAWYVLRMSHKLITTAAWACSIFIVYATLSSIAARPELKGAGFDKAFFTIVERFGAHAGAVAGLVGIKCGVVSGVINLESSGAEASDWRPRHDEQYHEG